MRPPAGAHLRVLSSAALGRPDLDAHLPGVVQNTEHQFVFVLFGFGELDVTRVRVQQLLHKRHVGGFGEPAGPGCPEGCSAGPNSSFSELFLSIIASLTVKHAMG